MKCMQHKEMLVWLFHTRGKNKIEKQNETKYLYNDPFFSNVTVNTGMFLFGLVNAFTYPFKQKLTL